MSVIKLAVIGECMIELSSSQQNVENINTMQQNFGGDSMNTAIYLKKMAGAAIDVHFISSMGKDNLSNVLIKKWQEYQIDTSSVLINPNKNPGLYMIQNDADGERTFQYWRNDSAAKYLVKHTDFSATIEKLKYFDAIYLSGISLAILPDEDCNILLSHLEQLAKVGIKIIFDSNYRPALWSTQEYSQEISKKVYALSSLALVTFDDELDLWGDKSIEACRERLHLQGVKELIIKDGENGCQYSKNGSVEYFNTAKVKNVVDTTAAGDSFNAGFLAYWLHACPIARCAKAGNLLAGQVIQQKGAIVEVNIASIINELP